MQLYALNMQFYANNVQEICKKNRKNMQLHRLYWSNMQKICSEKMQKYAVLDASLLQDMHKSIFCIYCIYMHSPLCRCWAGKRRVGHCGLSYLSLLHVLIFK